MELNKNTLMYAIVGIIALIVLYVLIFRPPPDFQTGCNMNCNKFTVDTDQYENWTSSMCGSGHDICCMEKVWYHVAGFKIDCVCCDCVTGTTTTDLGTCRYGFFLFDYLGSAMGLCEMPSIGD